jgi:preprotein translocase subunit SecE
MQTQRWVNLGLLLGSAVVFYVVAQVLGLVWDWLRLPLMGDLPVGPDVAISFAIAAIAGVLVRRNDKVNTFLNEVTVELMKVTWPQRNETLASTGVVVVMTIIAALVLLLFDTIWGTISQGVMG